MSIALTPLRGEPGIWNRHIVRPGFSGDITAPVDLIVPAHVAAKAGHHTIPTEVTEAAPQNAASFMEHLFAMQIAGSMRCYSNDRE